LDDNRLIKRESNIAALFNAYEIDLSEYKGLTFTDEELYLIRRSLSRSRAGSTAAVPMLCAGIKCPYNSSCPFWKVKKAPIGSACLVELSLLSEWIEDYVREYQVNPNSRTEFVLVQAMAETDIYLRRAKLTLANYKHADLTQDTVVGVSQEGTILTRRDINISLQEIKELSQQRDRLFKLMIGDRQEKAKVQAALKLKEDKGLANSGAELKAQLDQIKAELDEARRKLLKEMSIDAEFTSAKEDVVSPEDLIGDE